MKIILTKDLKDYMLKEGKKNIFVEVETSGCWVGVFKTVLASLVSDNFRPDENEYMTVETELGKVFLPNPGVKVKYDDEIKFFLQRQLWIKRIEVTGIN